MCLKVLLLINPFLIMQLERITIRSMNLISLSLDMVPGLKDGRSIRLNDILKVRDAGTVGISQVPDTSAGNNMRIRVPLSKKLNPGDAIYTIYSIMWCIL